MQPGYLVRRKETTGGTPHTEQLLEKAIEDFRQSIEATNGELRRLMSIGKIARVNYDLPSRFNPDIPSDDRLTVVWQEDVPVIVALETRDNLNFVDTVFAYPGPIRK